MPLEVLGFISNHLRLCKTEGCPLNHRISGQYFAKSQHSYCLPLFENIDSLKTIVKDYALFFYKEIPSIMLLNNLEFSFSYILLMLIDNKNTFPAIHQIYKLKSNKNLSFFHKNYIEYFLETILQNLKAFEEEQKKSFVKNKKCSTNFNTKSYLNIEVSFERITRGIEKYLDNYVKFLENLMLEKPYLQKIFNIGKKLLKLQNKIDDNYQSGSKIPRFIRIYLEFLHIFFEDERKKSFH